MHVVIGNEACDLDSTAAALSYAYYLCKKVSSTTVKFLNFQTPENFAVIYLKFKHTTGYLWSKYECFLASGSQDIDF